MKSQYLGSQPANFEASWNGRGLAILFFMLGAPHIYAAMRKRAKQQMLSGNGSKAEHYLGVALLAIAVADLVKVMLSQQF
jgi:hypothetical protein